MANQVTMQIFGFIAQVIAVGGSAALIAYGLFVYLGKSWLETKFAERLEAYRHKQNQDLEELRYRMNAQFNRVTKIHEKEIEVLPLAWSKLHNALGHVSYFTSPMRQYQDLDRLTAPQLAAFLQKSTFQDWEKTELQATEKKTDYYLERIFYHELANTKTAVREFHNYIQENSIFLSQDIKEKFMAVDDAMWKALIEKEIQHDTKDWKKQSRTFSEIQDEINPIKAEIEALVQKRLQLDRAL